MKASIIVEVAASLLIPSGAEAQPASPAAVLGRWAGCWSAEGQELNSQGEMFRQAGTARTVLEGDTLRLSTSYEVVQATGYYTRLARNRGGRQLLRIIAGRPFLTIGDVPAPGNVASPGRDVSISAGGDELFWSSMFHHPVRNLTLFSTTTYRLVGSDRMEGQTLLRDPHGDFNEVYVETWQRLAHTDPRCQGRPD